MNYLISEAFYEFDNLKNKTDDKVMNDFIEKYSIEEIISAFKCNGFGVNAYPNSKSYKDYVKWHSKIYEKYSGQAKIKMLNEYDQELKKWNTLFNDYYSKPQFEKVAAIDDDKKLYAFLICFELYTRALSDYKFNKGKNQHFYGKIDLQKIINGEIKDIDSLTANQFTDTIDYIFQQASKIVQAFIYYAYLYKNNKFICCSYDEVIDWNDIDKSMIYFPLIDIRNVLFDAFEEWKFGSYHLVYRDENNIEINPCDIKNLIDEKIESQRFESFRQFSMRDYGETNLDKVGKEEYMSKLLPPSGFLDKNEKASYNEYLEYFSSQKLDYKVDGVEIVKWLRAYSVVRCANRGFLGSDMFPDIGIPEKWLYISTSNEWIKKFIEHGIDEKSACVIFNRLIFKKNSIDWFDAPFIKIGEKIITVPSYTSHIQDVLALISLATKENINLDFKGYCFEDRILNDLNKNQISAVSIKRKIDKEEYQCDVAFILGQDLFLCECKHTAQPLTQRKRYDFYNRKVPEDVIQMNRISDFYTLNTGYVLKELNNQKGYQYSLEWKPRHIYRMIIYSCKLAGKLNIDGVIITDYTVFTTILYKRLPTILKNGKPVKQIIPPKMKGVFQGKLTTNKLINYMDNPWQIGFQKAFTEVEDITVPINKINLHRKRVSRTIDDFYDMSK